MVLAALGALLCAGPHGYGPQRVAANSSVRMEQTYEQDIDCGVSGWTFEACRSDGRRLRFREITRHPVGKGKACPAVMRELVPCPPVHCAVGPWGKFGECDSKGIKTRRRPVTCSTSGADAAVRHAHRACAAAVWIAR